MSSQEDLLSNLSGSMTDSTDGMESGSTETPNQEEEKTAEESFQATAEPDQEILGAEISEPGIEPESVTSEPEADRRDGLEEASMSQEIELPDMKDLGFSDVEEPELPDMKDIEQSDTDDVISDIDELIASMNGDISGMDDKNLIDDNEALNDEALNNGTSDHVDSIFDMDDLSDLLEEESEEKPADSAQGPDLNDVMEMSEDDIEKLLSNGFAEEGGENADSSDQDVLDMLEGTADDDLQDIQDMLQKSDNNEAVDDEVVKLLQEIPEKENLEEKILSGDGNPEEAGSDELGDLVEDPRKQKALEKKRLKEEKKAAKKAAKEAAKAEKAAKKRAKQAKKKRKNKNVLDIPVENANGEELLIDIDELDKLVSKAGQIGNEEPETENEEEPGDAGEDEFGVDLNNLFAGEESGGDDVLQTLDAADTEEQPDSEDADKKKREKREKKEKAGLLAKILSFLMEDDDEEEEKKENLRLSEENQGILNDLDKQGKTVKGGKGGVGGTGGKKDKKKDNKKEKPKKEAKPKKAPKPKPEKPPKEPEPYVPPKKRLTPKKVLPVILLGITVAASLLIFVNVSTDYVDKNTAKTAYYNGDYVTCYQNLNGKELNETEAVMYGRSESILYIRLWYREYEMFVEEGAEVEALDSLIQTVKNYPMLYEYASKWNAEGDVYAVYADILNILLDKYGITELQAKEIAKEKDDREYTRMVMALAEGKPYGSWNQWEILDEDAPLPNELPEESDLQQGNFVDNR